MITSASGLGSFRVRARLRRRFRSNRSPNDLQSDAGIVSGAGQGAWRRYRDMSGDTRWPSDLGSFRVRRGLCFLRFRVPLPKADIRPGRRNTAAGTFRRISMIGRSAPILLIHAGVTARIESEVASRIIADRRPAPRDKSVEWVIPDRTGLVGT